MKNIVFFVVALVAVNFFVSCEQPTMLSINQTALTFDNGGGNQSVAITANKMWTASSNQNWIRVSPPSGDGSAAILVSCETNTTYDSRTGTVTITSEELTQTISVVQAEGQGLQVSQTTYELTKAAQQLNIEVKANVKFSVEVDSGCKDWVKHNTTKGLTTSTVVLDIYENKSYDGREGKVTIKQDGGSLSSTITIKQSQLDGLLLTSSEYNLSKEKQMLTVEVKSNVDFDVKSDADWVKYVQTKGLSTKQIVLEVAENESYYMRETNVKVKQKNGDLSELITIKQKPTKYLRVSPTSFELTSMEQSINIEVKSNVSCIIDIPDDAKNWISLLSDNQNQENGWNTYKVVLAIKQNTTTNIRNATIVIRGEGCEDTVYITQRARPVPDDYDFEEGGLYYKIGSIYDLTAGLVGGEGVYSGVINIPTTLNHNGKTFSVTSIGYKAFYNSSVTDVTIGNKVKSIGSYAFWGTPIEKIIIPASINTLGEHSFDNCIKLSEVIFEDGTDELKFSYSSSSSDMQEFFAKCPIKKLYIGRTIEHYPFSACFADLSNTEEIVIGPCVTSIKQYLLKGASKITSLAIPPSVVFMGQGAFDKCDNLKKLIFEDGPDNLTYTGGRGSINTGGGTGGTVNYAMFCDSPLDYVHIGRNCIVSHGSNGALLDYTPITTISIGKFVTDLVELRFLRELKTITIPSNVCIINSFSGCNALRSIKCENETPPSFTAFGGFPNVTYSDGVLYVPNSSIELYKTATIWENFFNILPL